MDRDDPYNWTVDQVYSFFRDDAQRLLNELPNQPALPDFLPAVKDNDISGFVLLTDMATEVLRDEFGIRSFGQRSSLLYCINKLRDRSWAYNGQSGKKGSPQSSTPTPMPMPTPGLLSSSETLAAEQPSSAPTRTGEVEVQDVHGRKRRKLNLSAVTTVTPQVLPPVSEGCYFGHASMPVDALFYGKTQLGREIEHPESAELTLLDTDRANNSTEHNFQFHGLQKPAGEAHYVYRQVHWCFQQDPIEYNRRGQSALALLPYREELSQFANKVRSAMVIQYAGDSDTPVAIRENAAYLENGGDYNGIAQESALGQFDYLNEKYRSGDQDRSDTESISSAAFDEMQADIDAEWDAEKKEVAASQAKNLSKADIESIVDETVDSFMRQWNAITRPRKEVNQAWTVWKAMKKSKSRQLGLIEDAKAKVDKFSSRLSGQKSNVVIADCRTKNEVLEVCEALRATVMDREEQKWKIDVWQRKREPEHVVRHGQHTGANAVPSAGPHNASFIPHPDDRLSIEPGPTPVLEDKEDVFLTPQGSPTPHQGEADEEDFDGSDEASNLDDFVDDDAVSLNDPPLDDATEESRREEDTVSPATPPSVHEDHDKRARSLSTSSSDQDGLPPMKSFFSQNPKKTPKRATNHSFAKPSEPASASASRHKSTAVIEISSDSASTPQSSSARSGRGRTKTEPSQQFNFDANPENASVRDVDSWDMQELIRNTDRKRIIIKLLREEGSARLFAIKAHWIKRAMVGFKEDVLNLFTVLRTRPETSDNQPAPVLQSARLALVWHFLRPEIMKGDYPQSIDWRAVERDMGLFVRFFAVLMQKTDGRLFVAHEQSPSPSPAPNKTKSSDIIEIDSDSPLETPHSRRKRRVRYSEKVVETQQTAMVRLERYKAAETQSSNSQQLLAMVGSDSPAIPIDLLKQDEGAHFFHPAIAANIREHQINGVRFMWRELNAGVHADENGQGCVLAHAMGLGKTMQTITLLVAVNQAACSEDPLVSSQLPKNLRPLEVTRKDRSLRVLVLCPPSLLENWRSEINQWSHGSLGGVYTVDSTNKKAQMDILHSWHVFGGVLLMGYELFTKRVNRTNAEEKAGEQNPDGEMLDKYLLEGPEILVADEAHTVKNIGAGRSIAVNRIETRSRIALTGTPMSNNVGEIYALISFAAPGFLGGPVEFKAKFGEPIEQGTYADSTYYEQRRSKQKLATLSRLIEPKINRADITALKGTLQPKVEFVVTLPLTDLQRSVYNKYLEALLSGGKNDEASQVLIFSWLSLLGLLTNHPLAFKRKLNEPKKPPKSKPSKLAKLDGGSASPRVVDDDSGEGIDFEDEGVRTSGFTEEIIRHITSDIADNTDPSLSAKMKILMDILALSKQCGDKVLVFSSSIPTLDYVEHLLRERGTPFGRIDGDVHPQKRPQILAAFSGGTTELLLISTRAGGVGLNIQAANRVVILDFGFNPAHEEQAIGRAYRFGQTKPVFVYRLVAGGTFEDNIYNKQLFKTSLTQRVVDKKNPRRNAARSTRNWLYEPKDVPQEPRVKLEEWLGKDPEVFDRLLGPQLSQPGGIIRKLTTIETLQKEGDDPPLDETELLQAEEEYQMTIAAAMGPRGQVANLEGVTAFAAAQARQMPTSRVTATQQGGTSRMMWSIPSAAPAGTSRPKQTIHLPSTKKSTGLPQGITHGLPFAPRSPE